LIDPADNLKRFKKEAKKNWEYYKKTHYKPGDELALIEKAKNGDRYSIDMLVKGHALFVINIVLRDFRERITKHQTLSVMDLIQEGNIGIIQAIPFYEYRPEQPSKFLSYAIWRIRATILKSIYENYGSYYLPEVFFRPSGLTFLESELAQELGRLPSESELLAAIQKYPDEKKADEFLAHLRMRKEHTGFSSLDMEYGEEKTTLAALYEDLNIEAPDTQITQYMARDYIAALINERLNTREQTIVTMHLGLETGSEAKSFKEIAGYFDVTSRDVKKIFDHAMKKIRFMHASRIKNNLY
jgi:RNA polymerase sigma factor (sigma-70 family)